MYRCLSESTREERGRYGIARSSLKQAAGPSAGSDEIEWGPAVEPERRGSISSVV